MKTVPLYGRIAAGRVALVDDGDFDLVMAYRWNCWEVFRGRRLRGPYAIAYLWRGGNPTTIKMHKLITGYPATDHIDHNGLNNQRSNLRVTDGVLNQRNKRPVTNHSSKFKGVAWVHGKWRASIKANGRTYHLGRFTSEVAAANAYDRAARELFGEHAFPNFPD